MINFYSGEHIFAQADETRSENKYSYRLEQRVCAVSMGNLEDLDIARDFRSDVDALPDKFCLSLEARSREAINQL